MEKNSNSTRIYTFLYKKNKKSSAKEISNETSVPINFIPPSMVYLIAKGLVKKESLNGHYSYYWIPEKRLGRAKEILGRMNLSNAT